LRYNAWQFWGIEPKSLYTPWDARENTNR